MNKISLQSVSARSALFLQIFRFGIVGTIAAIIHFSIVILLVQNYVLAPMIANIFGFMVGFQLSYWGHRNWTFNDTESPHRIAFSKLFLVQMVNLGMNELLFYTFLCLDLPYPIALIIVLMILPMFTFIVSKLWIFKSA